MKGTDRLKSIPIPLLAVALLVAAIALFFCWRFRLSGFAGDMGVKHLQALTFQQGPLELPYPGARFDPSGELFPFEPPVVFETPRGWVSIWLNPMVLFLIPLFDRLFGWAGYLMAPFLGGLLTLHALHRIGKEMRLPRPDMAAALAWIFTPLLFYTLVLWEHTLAVGCGLMALASLMQARRKGAAPLGPGFWLGGAALFRVEAALAAGLLCLAVWLPKRDGRLVPFPIWSVCALAPPVVWGAAMSRLIEAPATGQILFPYLSPFSPWTSYEWTPHLIKVLQMLVEPYQDAPFAILLAAGAFLLLPILAFAFPSFSRKRTAWGLGLLAGMGVFLSGFQFFPLAPFHAGILVACPAMAAVPFLARAPRTRALVWAWVVGLLLLIAIAPNHGGLQRGCRYLLLPCVLGAYWVTAEWLRARGKEKFFLGVLLLVGLFSQAKGVQVLWSHQSAKETALAAILRERPDFVLTSVWYFPQEAGRIYHRVPILWARTSGDVGGVIRDLENLPSAPRSFITILPNESINIAEVQIPYWSGKRIENFGRLPMLKFDRIGSGN